MSFKFVTNASQILYRDRAILVMNKPAGMITQGTKEVTQRGKTIDGWIDDFSRTTGCTTQLRTVHRLDRETTGAYLLALGPSYARDISHQFESRKVEKSYLAVVKGRPAQDGLIQTLLAEEDGRVFLATPQSDTKLALALYTVVAESSKVPGLSLLRMRLFTGLKHQLRIQAARVLGAPIIGDNLYGESTNRNAWDEHVERGRMYLHSQHIVLDRYMRTGKHYRLGISAGVPSHFARLCDNTGLPLTQEDRSGGVFVDGEKVRVRPGRVIEGLEGCWLPEDGWEPEPDKDS